MTRSFDIAVIGGSLGGVQAARAACLDGMTVYLCEETDWLGGQMTSQAVPPDEHPWIETQGATQSYLDFRSAVRAVYLSDPDASGEMLKEKKLNPGKAWVSNLSHDPRISLRLLEDSLKPYSESGRLTIELRTRCIHAQVRDDRVLSVTVEDSEGRQEEILAAVFLDATETGELLPLTHTEYSVGAEGREATGEPHAPQLSDPGDQQPVTWVGALEMTGEREWMEKPDAYEDYRSAMVKGVPLLGWQAWGAHGLTQFAMEDGTPGAFHLGLWHYRRIQYPPYYQTPRPEISLLNWPQNDYVFAPVIDSPHAREHLESARALTQCCAYWLWEQGWPIRWNREILGTPDGLAKAPYIRESRRILAKTTVLEQEIAKAFSPSPLRRQDSVGVGHYAIDLHITTHSQTCFYEEAHPFEIPLGSLIPVRMTNLIPACKNVGATHLTGGCFREHPVEWTVGEAAGHLAAYGVKHRLTPEQVALDRLEDFQSLLVKNGFQLHWHNLEEKES